MTLVPLPAQPADTSWPRDEWPEGSVRDVDGAALDRMVGHLFTEEGRRSLGRTKALVIVQRGRIVLERYDQGVDHSTTLPSWSIAKTFLHGVIGVLVREGDLDVAERAEVAAWQEPDDRRREITIDALLRMSSGLEWVEDYEDDRVSDVITMLYGDGRSDMAAYAATKPLLHPPDTVCHYSSGTSLILSEIAGRRMGDGRPGVDAFLRRELFEPLGMRSAIPKYDGAGTWIASTYCFATARDFARFGLLYLRDGVWDDERILPEGWVDAGRTPTPTAEAGDRGAHWQILPGSREGTFFHSGYQSQYLVCVPALDLVVVRLGETPLALKGKVLWWVARLVRLFARRGR